MKWTMADLFVKTCWSLNLEIWKKAYTPTIVAYRPLLFP